MLDGIWTYRFGGVYVQEGRTPHHLIGIGHLRMAPDGTLTGGHHASMTPLQGSADHPAEQTSEAYTLRGRYGLEAPLAGWASIEFISPAPVEDTAAHLQDMRGEFRLVGVGDYDRFWLISTAGRLLAFPFVVNEVVSGEAVRVR